jgi:hypothetical protein
MKQFIIVILLITSFKMTAQYGNNESRPYYPNPKKGEKIDPIDSSINYLKKELILDDFQAAAIKTLIAENHLYNGIFPCFRFGNSTSLCSTC